MRELGIKSSVSVRMFADATANDGALRVTTARGPGFAIETAPFGGFIAVV
ncbi:hypothetical protein [Streptomyces sp. SP18BB07]|nr:hypothetical protein [Streptomyces sp. SP18BB07]MEE1758413.1 hypothetical protein [Streptomyces sp. SP18BB07]